MGTMATVYLSESDVARDLRAVLARVKQGTEVVIEQDHKPCRGAASAAAKWTSDHGDSCGGSAAELHGDD